MRKVQIHLPSQNIAKDRFLRHYTRQYLREVLLRLDCFALLAMTWEPSAAGTLALLLPRRTSHALCAMTYKANDASDHLWADIAEPFGHAHRAMTYEPNEAEQSKLAVYLHGKNARVQVIQEPGLHIVYFESPFYPLFTWDEVI